MRKLNYGPTKSGREKAEDSYNDEVELYKELQEKSDNGIAAYKNMLEQVHAWQPPTKDHQGLKEFMIQQLESSIEWDKHDYSSRLSEKRSAEEFKQLFLDTIEKNISYYEEQMEKEARTINERNEWIDQLVESLSKGDR